VSAEDRRRIRRDVERFRVIASRTPPWTIVEREGTRLLWDVREDRRLATLDGAWSPDVARYLDTVNPYAGLALAELLWRVGLGIEVEDHTLALLRAMRLPP
jgi:hypothetical protein